MLSIAVSAMSICPLRSRPICVVELGAAVSSTLRPRAANKPFSCATKIGQFALPPKPITRRLALCCACAAAAATNATMASQWAMKAAGYDTPMVRALALMVLLGVACPAASSNRDIYMYQGADREARDVFETSSPRMEALYRQNLLQDFYTPAFAELQRTAFPRGHRQYVA